MNRLKINLSRFARLRNAMLAVCMGMGIAQSAQATPSATPPQLSTVTGTATYYGAGAGTVIAPNLTLNSDPSITFTTAKVTIGAGFVSTDRLGYTTTHGITGSYDASTGILTLNGSGTAAQYQDALRTVTYSNTVINITSASSRTINFMIGAALYNEYNGHFYELVNHGSNINWNDARTNAAAKSLYGLQGYLVTVTSAQENTFLSQKINSNTWMGASDVHTEGTWRWVTGPEGLENSGLGRHFSNQFKTGACSANQAPGINGYFSSWGPGEPNDCSNNEDVAHFIGSSGNWNDYPHTGGVSFYLVEYGGMPGDPSLQLTDDVAMTVNPTPNYAPVITTTAIGTGASANEDVAATTAVTVSSLLSGRTSDINGNTLGMAVYEASGAGQWQRSTDGGNTWYGVDYLSPGNAPLSASNAVLFGPTVRIRFVPNANWNGTATLSFRAWDQTSGSAMSYVNIGTNGGNTAFSAETGTVSQVIDAVNDAPIVVLPNTTGVLNFGGASEYVDLPDLNITGPNFTVEAWLYVDNRNKNWARVIDFGNGSGIDNIILGLEGTTGRLFMEVYNGTSLKVTAPSVIPTGQWVHIAAVWNGTTGTIYQNGVAIASGAQRPIGNLTRVNNYIGKSNWSDEYFDGKMTDIRMWSTARSQTEIASNMNTILQGNETGLMLYYKAAEPGSTYLADYGALKKKGTFHNTNWVMVQTPVASVTTMQDSALTISPIGFDDVDAASGTVKATFSVGNGTLTASTGATVTGNGTATLQVEGTIAQLTSSFAGNGLVYQPNTGWFGTDALRVVIEDLGNTGSGGNLTDSASIVINVTPSPNEAPVINNQTLSINENSPNGSVVGTIAATDADGDTLTFSLVSQVPAGIFQVLPNGQITVANAAGLDYETNDTVTLVVEVTDGEFTKTATVTVAINNLNEAPVMQHASISVDEDNTISLATAIDAANPNFFTDVDGDDGTFLRFTSLPSNGTITIDGQPAIIGQLYDVIAFYGSTYTPMADYNGVDTFAFEVRDAALWPAAPATVSINVNPVNDAPVLGDVYMVTDEDQSALVTDFTDANTFNDFDAEGMAWFKVLQAPQHGTLQVNGTTVNAGDSISLAQFYVLSYVPNADFNGSDSFTWNGSDGTEYAAANATVYITVNPVNDVPTAILPTATTVDENLPNAATVLTLIAADVDTNENHYFQLVSGQGDQGNIFFYIDGSALKVSNNINYEQTTQLSFRVQVVDQAGATYEEAIVLDVNDLNDTPYSLALTNNIVDEQQGAGAFVGNLITSDEDANDSHTLTLVSGAGDADNASFAIVNNVLVTDAVLDFNTQQQYSIRVRSTDAAGAFIEETFVINLQDVNQVPTAVALSNATIVENNLVGQFIGSFTATDPDAGDTHTYTLASGAGDADNASFTIDNGDLKAAASFDFETKDTYSIRVRATDAAGEHTEEVFTITVIDATDAPIGITLSNNTIDENDVAGTLVGGFSTQDPDQINGFTYSLVGGVGADDNGAFFISGSVLMASASFDYETKNSYSIRVRSEDNGGGYTEEVFTVTVNDRNDAPTGITTNVIGIDENSPVGTAVGFFGTIDQDILDTHTYTLAPGFGANDNGKFSIVANKLQVNANLDYEQQSTYSVRVRSTDNAGAWTEQHMSIIITDVNEVPTAITLSAMSIAENNAAGATVGTFGTTDQDHADSHTYTFVAGQGDADNGAFHISGNMLIANASFNFEVKNSYNIRVASTDLGGLSTEAMFTITIIDVIDAPLVTNLSRNVLQNATAPLSPREFLLAFSQDEGNVLQSIRITSLPLHGTLTMYNVPVTVGQTILLSELSSTVYAPGLGYRGIDEFGFMVFDGVSYSLDATYTYNVLASRQVGATTGQINTGTLVMLGQTQQQFNRESEAVGMEEIALEATTLGNHPNPFQGATSITFELPASMKVTLEVYDVLGRKVETLVDGEELTGANTVQWTGHEAGTYICRLVATGANGETVTKTINLLQVK